MNDFTEQPSNIRWHNMPYSSCNRYTRKILAIILALIIILASFGIVIAAKYIQLQFKQKMSSDVDCTYLKVDDAGLSHERFDNSLTNTEKIKTYCYCFNEFIKKGPLDVSNVSITYNGKTFTPCDQWVKLYLQSESLRYGVIVLIPIVNFILSVFLECKIILIQL
jgi:hypothetical protein